MNSLKYWWNYPLLWDIGAVIVRTGSSSSNYFGIFQLGWALTLCSFSARSMGCNVHVTTRGWIQLAVLVELPHFFETLSRYCTYRLFQLQLFWYLQLGWALTLSFLFSTLQWVVTYMWLVDDSTALVELSPFLWDIGAVIVRTGSSSSNYFWYLSTRMGPNPFVPFQHAPMGCNVHVTTRGWIQPVLGTIPISLHWSHVQALPAPTIFGIFHLGWALTLFLSACSMGCNDVTTVDEFNSVLVELSPFLWDIGVIVCTGSSSSTILVSFN
jgi:hypothetical protein